MYSGTQGCMYCDGVCTKECIQETNHKTKMNKELDNTEATLFNQLILVRYNIDALKFGTYIDEFRHKEIIKSYDILTDMIFKYIEKLKQNENE